ncbi:hypothetical protein [Streptomyces coeruleorubidus]|uniref:Uncharacterized protein n=1 Tax=Streptomyces coeruleorubidus TaxID=116188 RepID=A0A5J6HZQ9_STRC4|nr:hypothetical protein [Streptomyces coeruleorubidus]QEV23883.1 hypothetical protein CP976_06815 [Streptomyces coeruleorubidus]GGT86402.1 hypothetical protein GCM10010256_53300 [Streptomyces coeruleorubidus]
MQHSAISTPERAVSLILEAEVMTDLDTGELTLIASTDHHQGDLDEVSPARLREMVADAHARLAAFERLADEQEARETLRALLAEHEVEMEEWDASTLDPKMREAFKAFAMVRKDSLRLVVVPLGQSPIERLAVVRDLVAHMDREQA